ncbi:MAG: hypothetical protein ACHQ6T_15035 [Myxococcota bacterium]
MLIRTIAAALALALLGAPAQAATTRYNPLRAGHPLRIIAYVLHPVGVIADELLFRPAWWLGTHEPLRTLFGVEVVVDDSEEVARAAEARNAQLAPSEEPRSDSPPDSAPDSAPAPANP